MTEYLILFNRNDADDFRTATRVDLQNIIGVDTDDVGAITLVNDHHEALPADEKERLFGEPEANLEYVRGVGPKGDEIYAVKRNKSGWVTPYYRIIPVGA